MIFCINVDTFETKRINETFNVSSVLFLPLGKMLVDQSYWNKKRKKNKEIELCLSRVSSRLVAGIFTFL